MPSPTGKDSPPVAQPVSEETVVKIAKEITVKFIEVGRITPSNFGDTFDDIYTSVKQTVLKK